MFFNNIVEWYTWNIVKNSFLHFVYFSFVQMVLKLLFIVYCLVYSLLGCYKLEKIFFFFELRFNIHKRTTLKLINWDGRCFSFYCSHLGCSIRKRTAWKLIGWVERCCYFSELSCNARKCTAWKLIGWVERCCYFPNLFITYANVLRENWRLWYFLLCLSLDAAKYSNEKII